MTEFRVGDKVQVELPRGYSKRGVLGVSVLFTTSPEARFENAIGTITQINPRGPYSVPQFLVDFRAHDNARLGIPWQAQWFREEWLTLKERPAGRELPPTPPTPPGPPVRAEDSAGPFDRGASPGGDDRTPAQTTEEANRLAEPTAAPPGSVDLPGPGRTPSGSGRSATDSAGAPTTAVHESVAGSPTAGDDAFQAETHATDHLVAIEPAAPSAPAEEWESGIGGDRVGRGAALLSLPDDTVVSESVGVERNVESAVAPAEAPATPSELDAAGDEFVDIDDRATHAAGPGGADLPDDVEEMPAGVAGITASGAPVGVSAQLTADDGDEPEVIAGGAVEESELGAATMAAALAAPAGLPATADVVGEATAPGYVHVSDVQECPPGFPIKGNASSKIFHLPGQSSYEVTMPEICFASVEDAVAAGYRPRKGAAGAREARSAFREIAPPPAIDDEPDDPAAPGEIGHTSAMVEAAEHVHASRRLPAPEMEKSVELPHEVDDDHYAGHRKVSGTAPAALPYDEEPADSVTAAGAGDLRAALAAGAQQGAGWVRGDGSRNCPEGFPLKGNAKSNIYHRPADDSYQQTIPEVCFASDQDAETAGFRPRSGGHRAHGKGKHRR